MDDQEVYLGGMTAYELIELLDKAHPHRCISALDTLETAHREAGRRVLIDELVAAMRSEREATEEAPTPARKRRAPRNK